VHGKAEQHWVAAERQVLSEMATHLNATTTLSDQKKPAPARRGRPTMNVRPQSKKVAVQGGPRGEKDEVCVQSGNPKGGGSTEVKT
jgi:hypothetical protein